jgi:hypothetical protein
MYVHMCVYTHNTHQYTHTPIGWGIKGMVRREFYKVILKFTWENNAMRITKIFMEKTGLIYVFHKATL